jgi:hypothetical protein
MKICNVCLTAASAVFLAACQDVTTNPPELAPANAASAAPAPSIREEEAELHQLAAEVPGFGGYYFDENGETVAFVTDLARADQARAAVQARLARNPVAPRGGRVLVRQGRYTFPELAAWRDRITGPVVDIEGVESVDANEGRNRVVIGISSPAAQRGVEQLLAEHRVPREAVVMEAEEELSLQMAPEEDLAASFGGEFLSSVIRPLRGGIQIGRWTNRSTGKWSRCTLGAIVRRSGYNLFLTASHCSQKSWEDDVGAHYQPMPDIYDYDLIGNEYDDKRGSSCGFMSPNVCRYSDATLIRINSSIGDELGRIARTRYAASSVYPDTMGSLEIDPAAPYFQIVGRGPVSQGSTVHKMGARTGWTQGVVTNTCIDKPADRSYSWLRCQVATKTWVSPGDSGGPAFTLNTDGTVSLLGIFWGRTTSGSYHYYSPLSGIEKDLGSLVII